MTEKRVMKLASRGKRFGAACIDLFVPLMSYLMLIGVFAANGINPYYPGYGYGFGNDFGYGYGYGYGFGYGLGSHRLTGASAAILAVVFIILIAYIVVEFVFFAKGKTIGKAMLGMQVVSSTDGKPFRFWKMFFRECIVKSASGSVFCLGYIWILIDEKNRGWHDKILDSYVVDLKESEKMNYRRHLEQVRKETAVTEAAPGPVVGETEAEPVVSEAEQAAAGAQVIEEPVIETAIEVISEETAPESETAAADTDDEAEAKTEAEMQTAPEAASEEAVTDGEPQTPGLSMSMKKEELLEAARERGVKVSARATKAAIIEAIEKAETETEE